MVDSADPARNERIAQVREVLRGIGAGEVPELLVFNKIDRSGETARVERDAAGHATQVWCSAITGAGLDGLREAIAESVKPNRLERTLRLPLSAAALRSELYRRDAVRAERQRDDGGWDVDVELDANDLAALVGRHGIAVETVPERPADEKKRVA